MSQCVECHIPLSEASDKFGAVTYHDSLGNKKTGKLCDVCVSMFQAVCGRYFVNAQIELIKENRRLIHDKHSILGD